MKKSIVETKQGIEKEIEVLKLALSRSYDSIKSSSQENTRLSLINQELTQIVSKLRNDSDEKSARIIRMTSEIEGLNRWGKISSEELVKRLSDPSVVAALARITVELEGRVGKGSAETCAELTQKIQHKDREIDRLRAGVEALT
jgi:cell division protein FtsB